MCAHKLIKKYGGLLIATVPFLMLGSCISDKEVESDDYCYIWDVTLGSMKREVSTTNATGKDTTIVSSYTGSQYPMTINQRALTIENRDSLLYGTMLRAVLVDISYNGSSLVYLKTDGLDSTWISYSSSDSMDLRKPVEMLLISNDGLSSRRYTLKLNVHQQEGDSLYWKKTDAAVQQLQDMTQQRAVMVQGRLAVLGKSGNDVSLAERTSEGVWNKTTTNLPLTADVQTITRKGDDFFLSTADGDIYTSANCTDWQKLSIGQHPGMVLAGATSAYLYVLKDGGLYRCAEDNMGVWTLQAEGLDESPAWLPSKDVTTLQLQQSAGDERLVLVGNRAEAADKSSVVWSKTWNDEILEGEASWMFMNQTEENKYTLPQLEYLNLIQYDGKCMAFGGASADAKGTNQAMDALYVSEDYGISWRKQSELHLPVQLKGVNGPVTSVVDDGKVIWIIANGEVWRGKLNRLDFERQ